LSVPFDEVGVSVAMMIGVEWIFQGGFQLAQDTWYAMDLLNRSDHLSVGMERLINISQDKFAAISLTGAIRNLSRVPCHFNSCHAVVSRALPFPHMPVSSKSKADDYPISERLATDSQRRPTIYFYSSTPRPYERKD
jgi:hypothetical protein